MYDEDDVAAGRRQASDMQAPILPAPKRISLAEQIALSEKEMDAQTTSPPMSTLAMQAGTQPAIARPVAQGKPVTGRPVVNQQPQLQNSYPPQQQQQQQPYASQPYNNNEGDPPLRTMRMLQPRQPALIGQWSDGIFDCLVSCFENSTMLHMI